ncbi:MAG: hypothetical protein IPM84_14910 [Anaerolineae bacterium]|nr:hypothetical protein [Anaerolineae bacterium]
MLWPGEATPPRRFDQRPGQVDRAQSVQKAADRYAGILVVKLAIVIGVVHRATINHIRVLAGGRDRRHAHQQTIGVHRCPAAVAAGNRGVGLDPGPALDAGVQREAADNAA